MATPLIDRPRTIIYVVEVPAETFADKDSLLTDMAARCSARVAFALPTVYGAAVGFRAETDDDATTVAQTMTDRSDIVIRTGLGIHNRTIEIPA